MAVLLPLQFLQLALHLVQFRVDFIALFGILGTLMVMFYIPLLILFFSKYILMGLCFVRWDYYQYMFRYSLDNLRALLH